MNVLFINFHILHTNLKLLHILTITRFKLFFHLKNQEINYFHFKMMHFKKCCSHKEVHVCTIFVLNIRHTKTILLPSLGS
jgi:hypothetical protein